MGTHDEVRFTAGREQLADAVAFARAGLGGGKTLHEQIFRFDVGDGKVTLTASDGDLIAAADFLADVEGDGGVSFAVIGKKVADLLSRTRDADAFSVFVDTENAEFVIRRGQTAVINFERLDFALLDFATAAVEKARQVAGPAELEIPRGLFLEALEVAGHATAKNSGNVLVDHVELRQGRFLASDGRRIACVKSAGFHSGAKAKVPVPILGRLTTAVKTLPKDRALMPHEGDGHFFLVAPNRFLAIRKVENEFPAAEKMFETSGSTSQVIVDRTELQRALGEVGLGLPSGKMEVEVHVETDALTVLTENSVGRQSRHAIPLKGDAHGESFPIAIDHLTATLGSMKGKEVSLYVLGKTAAVLLIDANDARETMALLPFLREPEPDSKAGEEKAPGAAEPAKLPEATAPLDDGTDIVL